jgi:ribose transport system substrate-binding protein
MPGRQLDRLRDRVYPLRTFSLEDTVNCIPRYLIYALCPLLVGCGGPLPDELTIVVIPKGLTHEHWQSVRRGAERCASDLLAEEGVRVRVIFDGPLRERDAIEQIRIVDRRVATGAHGIVLAPQHSRTMTACVKRAADAGLPVVIIDSGLVETDHFVKYVATDNYRGGCLAAEHLLAELAKQGKTKPRLVLFRYAVGSESTEQREKGFEDTVKKLCPDAVWLSTDKYAGSTAIRRCARPGRWCCSTGRRWTASSPPTSRRPPGCSTCSARRGLTARCC